MRLLWFTLCFFCWNCLCVVAAEHGAPTPDSHKSADTHASAEKESHSDSAAPAAENQHLAYYQLKITPEAASKDSAQPAALIKLECTDLSQLPEGNPILIWKQPDGSTEHLIMRPVLDGIWANRLELPTQPGEHELMLLACRAGAPASEALLAYRWKVKLPQLEIKPLEGALLFAEAEPSSKKAEPSEQDVKAAATEKKVTRSWPLIALQLLLFNVLLAFGIGGMFVIYQRLPDRWLQRINGLPLVKLGAVEAIAAEHAASAVQTPSAASPTVGASAPLPATEPMAVAAAEPNAKLEKTEMLPPAGVDVDSTLSIINRLDEQLGGTEPSVQKAVETPAAETTPITPPSPPSPPAEQPVATAPAERESPNATPEEIDAWVKQMEGQYGAEEENATPAAPAEEPAPVVAAAVASPAPPPPPAERESPNATPEEIDAWVKQMESQYGAEEDETTTTPAEVPAPVVAAAVAPSVPEPAPVERESPNATPEEIDAWVKQMESQYGGVEEEEAPVAASTPPPSAEDPVAARLSSMERLLKEAEAQQQVAAAAPPVVVPVPPVAAADDGDASPDDIDAIMRQLQGESVKPTEPVQATAPAEDPVASRLSAMERLLKEAEAQQQQPAPPPPPVAAVDDGDASPDDIDAIMRQLQAEVSKTPPMPQAVESVSTVDAVATRLSAMERLLKEAEAQQQQPKSPSPSVPVDAPADGNASPDDIDAIMRQLQGESVEPTAPPTVAKAETPAPVEDPVASRLSAMERLLKEAEAQQQKPKPVAPPPVAASEPPPAAAPDDANASPDDIDAIMRQLQGESVKPASPPSPAPAPVAAAPIEPAPALDAVAARLSAMERLLKEAEAQQQAAVAAVNPVPSQSEPPVAEELPDPVRAEPKPPPEPKASFISVGADDDDLKLDLDDLSF